ncbi:MAG: nucleotide excision repair endonuclease [candidate division KSB1 bacterium]
MQDQIHNFIERCGGHASSMAIAANVLRLRNATPATAERVVGALLNTESRFAKDGVGNWYLVQTNGAHVKPARAQVCLVFTPMRARELQHARRIVLGWKILPDAPLHLLEVVLHSAAPAHEEGSGLPQCSATEFLQRHLPELQACALLAWNLAAVLATLRKVTTSAADAWLPPTRISLQNLSRNLLRLSRPPKLPCVHEQLLEHPPRSESWEDQMRAQAEIWAALQEHCSARGLQSWEQIAHYAQRPQRASFSQFDFDEKEIDNLPESPGVYVMKDRAERIVYVGKATNLRERVRSYFTNAFTDEAKLQQVRAQVARLHYELYDTELEALLREQALIKRFRPALNRQIEVHETTTPAAEKRHGIFLVPLRTQSRTAPKGRVIVYFLSAQNLKRVSVNLARMPQAQIRKATAEYIKQCAASMNATSAQRTQAEIARRWFQQNRSWISALSPHESEEAGKLAEQVLRLLRAPEIFHERVELAPQ